MRFSRLPLTDPEAEATYTHVRGVTGHHGVLMVGQYTCDPERVGSIFKSLYWYTTHKGRSEK